MRRVCEHPPSSGGVHRTAAPTRWGPVEQREGNPERLAHEVQLNLGRKGSQSKTYREGEEEEGEATAAAPIYEAEQSSGTARWMMVPFFFTFYSSFVD